MNKMNEYFHFGYYCLPSFLRLFDLSVLEALSFVLTPELLLEMVVSSPKGSDS